MRGSEIPTDKTDTKADTSRGGGSSTNRRHFLKVAGASAVAVGGLGIGSAAADGSAIQSSGPPNPSEWSVAFEDKFESGSLDKSAWNVGWGWGSTSSASSATASEANVEINDGTLHLSGTNQGGEVLAGAVNTKGTVEFGPGSFVEARLRFPERVGFHPAFWAKPASEDWPPEFDIVEVIQDGSGRDDTHTSRHFLHYSVSTQPGDESTHERVSKFHEPGDDLTENFHVYAAEWQSDRITYYVDGQEVQTWTDSTILESFRRGAPFYLTLNMNINVDSELNEYLGQVDLSESWGESLDVDWVRAWQQ